MDCIPNVFRVYTVIFGIDSLHQPLFLQDNFVENRKDQS